MGAFIISPLPHFDERSTYRSGLFPPGVFCRTLIIATTPRSVTLMPTLTFPTQGYSKRLFDGISPPGTEGFSS